MLSRTALDGPLPCATGDQNELDNFGIERAVNMLVYASRCNYTALVCDGFLLPLERDNAFIDFYWKSSERAESGE
jgi:hypothetical protein